VSGRATPTHPPVIDGFSDLVEIGRGGFSTVYAATQVAIERRVAVKVLDLGFSDEHRFRRECRTLGTLSGIHGIVPVLQAAFTQAGQPCIVMQLMDGGSLAHRIRSSGPMRAGEVIDSGLLLCAALQHAHDRRIFHRDIKPENVLFHADTAAIADFGIALVDDMESRSQTMDSISPPHAPPERFADGTTDPVLGDVYSLGSTLYTAVAGRPPFGTIADGGLAGLILRVTSQPVPIVDRADVPPDLQQVLGRSLSKDPRDRYPSMSAFGAALAAAAAPSTDVADERTVRRVPGSPVPPLTMASASTPPPPPHIPEASVVSSVPPAEATVLRSTAPTADLAHAGAAPPSASQVHPRSKRRRGVVALWATAAAMLVLSVAGGAYLAGRELSEPEAIASSATTTTSATSTTVLATTTTAEPAATTTVSTTTTTVPAPTTTVRPTPAPARAAPPAALPVSEATTAVDQYLAAASGFDVDAFAARWSYPIELQYTRTNVSEAALRESAERYFASRSDLAFTRSGPTEIAASSRGWETSTEYRAEQWLPDGTYKCEFATIRLGFDASWRVRTATEDSQRSC
jgi:serine/threonine protein kinase